MTTENELKPCPFCGGTPELVDSRVEWFVRCKSCKPYHTVIYGNNIRHIDEIDNDDVAAVELSKVDFEALKKSAVDAWNNRAPAQLAIPDDWLIQKEPNGNWLIASPSGDSAYVFQDDQSPLGEVVRQLVQTLTIGSAK